MEKDILWLSTSCELYTFSIHHFAFVGKYQKYFCSHYNMNTALVWGVINIFIYCSLFVSMIMSQIYLQMQTN